MLVVVLVAVVVVVQVEEAVSHIHTLKWCMRRAHANQYPPSCLMRSLS